MDWNEGHTPGELLKKEIHREGKKGYKDQPLMGETRKN
jgi:hypothetical protein